MRRARSVPDVVIAGIASLFGALVALIGPALTARVPIYVPVCAPCKYEYVIPNVVQVPLFAVAAGAALGLAHAAVSGRSGRIAALVRGAAAGLAAALAAGLVSTATLAFTDPYIGFAYRAYAVAFTFVVALVTVAIAVRAVRVDVGGVAILPAATFAGALLTAAAATSVRGSTMVGVAAVAGALLGAALSGTGLTGRLVVRARGIRPATVVAAVIAVALVLRLVFGIQALVRVGPGMPFALLSDDGPAYYEYAHGLFVDPATAGAVLSNSAGYPPLYSFFLATVFWLTRESIAVVIVIQALLAAVSTLLLYLIARDLAGRKVGLVAGALFAVDQNLIHSQATFTPEAVLVPLILAALYAVARYRRAGEARWIVATGALLGLAFITRNLIFVLTIALIGWLFARGVRRAPLIWLRDAALVVGLTLVAAAPVIAATAYVEGRPRLTNQHAGLGWSYRSDTGITIENGPLIDRGIDPMTDPAGSLRRVLADPLPVLGFYAAAVPQRVSALLFFPNFGSSDPLVLVNPAVYASPFGQTWLALLVAGLIAGGVLLARSATGERRATAALIAAYAVLYIALFAFVFPPRQAYRYRIPIQPLMQVVEAIGLVWMLGHAIRAWTAERVPAVPRTRT